MRHLLLPLCLLATPAAADDAARAIYLASIQKEAMQQGVPPALADAVAMVETGYQADAVGTSGEIGMMQVMPATARQLGFAGTNAELFDPATNIHLGVAYLSRAWAISGGNVCRALMKYRAGLGEEVMSPLSVTYCARAMSWLDAQGSDLAQGGSGAEPVAEAAAVPAPDPHVVALFPPLPEQAGLEAAPAMPVIVTPASYVAPAQAATGQLIPMRAAPVQIRMPARRHHHAVVDKVATAVNAALSAD